VGLTRARGIGRHQHRRRLLSVPSALSNESRMAPASQSGMGAIRRFEGLFSSVDMSIRHDRRSR
jgi:hypothetical protein